MESKGFQSKIPKDKYPCSNLVKRCKREIIIFKLELNRFHCTVYRKFPLVQDMPAAKLTLHRHRYQQLHEAFNWSTRLGHSQIVETLILYSGDSNDLILRYYLDWVARLVGVFQFLVNRIASLQKKHYNLANRSAV